MHLRMAEFTVLSQTYWKGEQTEEKEAHLFFVNDLFSEDTVSKTEASTPRNFRETYDNITKVALESPCFVLDRNQDFEHKASKSGPGCHQQLDDFITEELVRFLPSIDPEWVKHQAKTALKDISSPIGSDTKPIDHTTESVSDSTASLGDSDADPTPKSETASDASSPNPAGSISRIQALAGATLTTLSPGLCTYNVVYKGIFRRRVWLTRLDLTVSTPFTKKSRTHVYMLL